MHGAADANNRKSRRPSVFGSRIHALQKRLVEGRITHSCGPHGMLRGRSGGRIQENQPFLAPCRSGCGFSNFTSSRLAQRTTAPNHCGKLRWSCSHYEAEQNRYQQFGQPQ